MISKTAGLLCLLIVCTGFGVASTINTTPVAFGQVELSAFNGTVATFTDSNVNAQPADFNAQINWGDGKSRQQRRNLAGFGHVSSRWNSHLRG